jgi:hypothetical protein
MPYKNMFNGQYNVIFLESFDGHHGEDEYFVGDCSPLLGKPSLILI